MNITTIYRVTASQDAEAAEWLLWLLLDDEPSARHWRNRVSFARDALQKDYGLEQLFAWDDTPQGATFWGRIHDLVIEETSNG